MDVSFFVKGWKPKDISCVKYHGVNFGERCNNFFWVILQALSLLAVMRQYDNETPFKQKALQILLSAPLHLPSFFCLGLVEGVASSSDTCCKGNTHVQKKVKGHKVLAECVRRYLAFNLELLEYYFMWTLQKIWNAQLRRRDIRLLLHPLLELRVKRASSEVKSRGTRKCGRVGEDEILIIQLSLWEPWIRGSKNCQKSCYKGQERDKQERNGMPPYLIDYARCCHHSSLKGNTQKAEWLELKGFL